MVARGCTGGEQGHHLLRQAGTCATAIHADHSGKFTPVTSLAPAGPRPGPRPRLGDPHHGYQRVAAGFTPMPGTAFRLQPGHNVSNNVASRSCRSPPAMLARCRRFVSTGLAAASHQATPDSPCTTLPGVMRPDRTGSGSLNRSHPDHPQPPRDATDPASAWGVTGAI